MSILLDQMIRITLPLPSLMPKLEPKRWLVTTAYWYNATDMDMNLGTVDKDGNVWLTDSIGIIRLESRRPDSCSANGQTDVLKLDSTGAVLWMKGYITPYEQYLFL
jgi:hypothetical protein